MDSLAAIAYGFALLWGALWGSFLNVVVYRLPAGLSVVHPRSRCPSCLEPIRWWQNVPLVSYVLLNGRCFKCKTAISFRYPAVEAVAAALSLAILAPWLGVLLEGTAEPWQVVLVLVGEQIFVGTLLAIALIDADTFLVPNALSLPLPVLGLGLALAVGDLRGVSWQGAAAGALAAGGGLFALQWGYAWLTGREGLGTGDIKLLAGIGAFLGVASLPVVLLASAVQGLLFSAGYALVVGSAATSTRGIASMRHLAIPFGPFLALGAVQWLLLHRWLEPILAGLGGG